MADHSTDTGMPEAPIQRIVAPFERFLHIEASSGIVLVLATAAALILANSSLADGFLGFWKTELTFGVGSFQMTHSLKHWINDGLMAVFFFVIGLEVKRELVLGELRDLRAAVLPVAAAIGGMVVPAGIYLAFEGGGPAERGWGIPMATDIAFVVGCLAVLGSRAPKSLRIFLLSLAIVDDIGAILVIAIGYTESLDTNALMFAFVGIAAIFVIQRLGVRSTLPYIVIGVLVWGGFHESGVHATIAGVVIGLMTPAKRYAPRGVVADVLDRARNVFHGGDWDAVPMRAAHVRTIRYVALESVSPVEYLESALHPWVAFGIMPLFALANAGVPIEAAAFTDPVAVAIGVSLVFGKPLGILGLSFLVISVGLARMPDGMSWSRIAGGGFLAGIGFTMALFIAGLALGGPELNYAKVGILGASVVAAVLGMVILSRGAKKE